MDLAEQRTAVALKGFEEASQLMSKMSHENPLLATKLSKNLDKVKRIRVKENGVVSLGKVVIGADADDAVDQDVVDGRVTSVASVQLSAQPEHQQQQNQELDEQPEFSILL